MAVQKAALTVDLKVVEKVESMAVASVAKLADLTAESKAVQKLTSQ